MKTKHTPGPWYVSKRRVTGNHTVVTNTHRYIAIISDHPKRELSHEMSFNAKLIAAAPELLEALQEVREWYEENHDEYLGTYTPVCFNRALTAILQATS